MFSPATAEQKFTSNQVNPNTFSHLCLKVEITIQRIINLRNTKISSEEHICLERCTAYDAWEFLLPVTVGKNPHGQ